jgi:hypothetical protein
MTTLFWLLWVFGTSYSVLFYVLYLRFVLRRINEAQVHVHRPGVLFRQQRYVERYLELLSKQEKSRWYNIFLKHSFVVAFVGSTALLVTVVVMAARDLR